MKTITMIILLLLTVFRLKSQAQQSANTKGGNAIGNWETDSYS
jgi:hypothetical protein